MVILICSLDRELFSPASVVRVYRNYGYLPMISLTHYAESIDRKTATHRRLKKGVRGFCQKIYLITWIRGFGNQSNKSKVGQMAEIAAVSGSGRFDLLHLTRFLQGRLPGTALGKCLVVPVNRETAYENWESSFHILHSN